jgi:hypothetical protein
VMVVSGSGRNGEGVCEECLGVGPEKAAVLEDGDGELASCM